ncbi:MAG: hypothetical protein ACMG6E_07555 [Candidatus Roizmanbacteria bacterium]
MLSNIVQKYNNNENYQKRINITSFQEGVEEYLEEEDVLEFQDAKCSELLTFVKEVIEHNVVAELAYTSEVPAPLAHNTTYGLCS